MRHQYTLLAALLLMTACASVPPEKSPWSLCLNRLSQLNMDLAVEAEAERLKAFIAYSNELLAAESSWLPDPGARRKKEETWLREHKTDGLMPVQKIYERCDLEGPRPTVLRERGGSPADPFLYWLLLDSLRSPR